MKSIKELMQGDPTLMKLMRKRKPRADHPTREQCVALRNDYRAHPEWDINELARRHNLTVEVARARLLKALRVKE